MQIPRGIKSNCRARLLPRPRGDWHRLAFAPLPGAPWPSQPQIRGTVAIVIPNHRHAPTAVRRQRRVPLTDIAAEVVLHFLIPSETRAVTREAGIDIIAFEKITLVEPHRDNAPLAVARERNACSARAFAVHLRALG